MRFTTILVIFLSLISARCDKEDRILIDRLDIEDHPNIVLIYVDDLGYTDLGSYGNQFFETPNIDDLVNSGLMFTQAYSSAPLCAPSRIALLTGRHNARAGCYEVTAGKWDEINFMLNVAHADPSSLDLTWPDEVDITAPYNSLDLPQGRKIIPEYLKEIGYFTGFFGKWHVGPQKAVNRGFDEYVVMNTYINGAHLDIRNGQVGRSSSYPDPNGTSAEYMTEVCLRFLDNAGERPFFLYCAHPLVHTPLEAMQSLIDKYEAKPSSHFHSHATYAAMVEMLDNSIGEIIEGLQERGMMDNTLIIFTSDNGGMTGNVKPDPYLDGYRIGAVTSNYPLCGGKCQLWEGGIRIPMAVVMGDKIPVEPFEGPVTQMDILPTLLDISGHPDYEKIRDEFDGRSLYPVLANPGNPWPERPLFWHHPWFRCMTVIPPEGTYQGCRQRPASAVRRGNWKLIESLETGDVQLYNLFEDPGETQDVTGQYPDMVQNLRSELSAWRTETKAPMPVPK